ncbi:MAG: type II toxin-antitoxin system VapC family toxin [Chloroflexi bacterium]|nr:type II toxin-antitoxin system VapC family toxin [Chloroflexota bacterium]
MAVFYLESSAFFKRYRTEKGTDVLNAVISQKREADVLVTSHLVTVEMESVVARGLKSAALTKKAGGVLLRSFAEDLDAIIVLPISTSLVVEASRVAARHGLRALDAIHFATLIRVSQAAPGSVVFVAADKEMVQAARADNFVTLNPEERSALDQLRKLQSL